MHAASRFRAGQLAPEDGRQVEAHQIVQRAASEVGFDQRHVDLARVGHRFVNGGLGDGVEGDAFDVGILLDRLAFGQRLLQVPTDRLTLAVRVGGEDQGVVVLKRVGDGLDVFLAVRGDLPKHIKFVLGID